MFNNEEGCSECKDGYYLETKKKNFSTCTECERHCKKCQVFNLCEECYDGYEKSEFKDGVKEGEDPSEEIVVISCKKVMTESVK